jgi:hypothetical protein
MGFKRSWVQIPPARGFKHQIPEKHQAASLKRQVTAPFEVWFFGISFGAWILGFGMSRMRDQGCLRLVICRISVRADA